jgi:Flp pilus assembly protein TadG
MWIVTVFMSLLGAVVGFGGMILAKSAPQEAAAAAMGLTCAVIPYCIARAFTELRPL